MVESAEGIAKSRGDNTSKVNLAVDTHGNPIGFIISDGVTYHVTVVPALIRRLEFNQTVSLCVYLA